MTLLNGLLLVTASFSAQAATKVMHEPDEPIEGGYPTLSETSIAARSPLRDTSGNDALVHINAQYNQTRGSTRSHVGVDLQASSGRTQYATFGGGSKRLTNLNTCEPTGFSGYGRFALVQHTHPANGKTYQFQSFHAHLATVATLPDTGITTEHSVGTTGGSGNCSNSAYPAHVHLENRTPTADGAGPYRYPPSWFYLSKGDWGMRTSFINHIGGRSSNEVGFRIAGQVSGCTDPIKVDPNTVELYYRKVTSPPSAWSGPVRMDAQADDVTFYKNLASLLGIGSYYAEYYVTAKDPTWPMSTCVKTATSYRAYRPYRYEGEADAPKDRPFKKYISSTSGTSLATAETTTPLDPATSATWIDQGDPNLKAPPGDVPSYLIEKPEQFAINLAGRVVAREGDLWILQSCGEDFICPPGKGRQYLVRVINPSAADLWVGRRTWVKGNPGGWVNGRQVIVVTSEFGIDPKDEDGVGP